MMGPTGESSLPFGHLHREGIYDTLSSHYLYSVTLAWVSPASWMTTHETFDKKVRSKDVNSWSSSDAQTPHTQEPSKS